MKLTFSSPLSLVSLGVMVAVASVTAAWPDQPAEHAIGDVIATQTFDNAAPGSFPADWIVTTASYQARVIEGGAEASRQCLQFRGEGKGETGILLTHLDPAKLRGRMVMFSAKVRTTPGTDAQLWLRVDRERDQDGFFDNMTDRPIKSDTWGGYEITGDVAPDAASIVYGLLIFGPGPVWIDSISITDAGPRVDDNAPLSAHGRDNLIALTRLVGVLRSFSPTTEANSLDWDRFMFDAIDAIEPCTDADSLIQTLKAWTLPIAPGVVFWRGDRDHAPAEPERPADATGAVAIIHNGFAQPAKGNEDTRNNAYSSSLVTIPLDAEATDSRPAAGETVTISLGGDVYARIPIAPYVKGKRTLPVATAKLPAPIKQRAASWHASPRDRDVRFAVLIQAWNTLNHFYPYFDVSETDWVAALPPALEQAATDASPEAFGRTLAIMHAKIKDGHGWISGPGISRPMPKPYSSEWVGDEIVVRRVADSVADRILPGDVIEAIDGRSVHDLYAEIEPTICAATEQWKRHRALGLIGWGVGRNDVTLSLKRGTSTLDVTIPRAQYTEPPMERPADGAELAPGIVYFNLDGGKLETLAANMNTLAAAKGIIFDLRGYPESAGSNVLPHLSDAKIQSARWRVPIIARPNYQRVRFAVSNWNLPPQQPRLTSNIAFLTDGRAISYAESCMGIVEAYSLGEIVGSTTAGTNGNITSVTLPCGYSLTWTGMQVLKNDGSRHHGVGIKPTVPITPTKEGLAAGRDEVLEKAIEIVKAKLEAELEAK